MSILQPADLLIYQYIFFPIFLYIIKIYHKTIYPTAQTIQLPKWKSFCDDLPVGIIYIVRNSVWYLTS